MSSCSHQHLQLQNGKFTCLGCGAQDDTLEAQAKKGERLAELFKDLTGIDSRTFCQKG